ncbi:MAG: DUF5667 domain-containing protein [Candidatus Liptonbacteria bacterium]
MDLHEKISQLKTSIHLSETRKRELKSQLLHTIDAQVVLSRHESTPSFFAKYIKPMPLLATLVVVILIGGSVSAAQAANPGDFLYAMKVNVNEKVEAALTIGSEAKAQKDTTFAERRLTEVANLAAKGSLNDSAKQELISRFSDAAQSAKKYIDQLRAEGNTTVAAELASHLESVLTAHENILSRLQAASASTTAAIFPIAQKVRGEIDLIKGERDDLDSEVEHGTNTSIVVTAANGRIGAAEKEISAADNFITSKASQLGASSMVDASNQLLIAKNYLTQAKTARDAGNFGQAFVLAGQAMRTAQQAKLRVRVNAVIHGDSGDDENGNENENELGNNRVQGRQDNASTATARERIRQKIELDGEDTESRIESLLKAGL